MHTISIVSEAFYGNTRYIKGATYNCLNNNA